MHFLLVPNCSNMIFNRIIFYLFSIFPILAFVGYTKAESVIVYSTNFDSFNSRLALTGQGSWVTNDPKSPGEPAGESDGLTKLQFPDNTNTTAAYIGGPYRAAYPPGKTNVMLWPEISGLGATLKFEVQMLLQPSDLNGIYSESDAFAWNFLDRNSESILSISFEPIINNPNARSLVVYNSDHEKIILDKDNTISVRNLYDLEVLMEPQSNGLNVNIKMTDIEIANFNILDCSTYEINAVTANWIMTDGKVHDNGIVTGFGSNYMAFDNYTLTSDYADYIRFEDSRALESDGSVTIIAKLCKPSDSDISIDYEIVDGTAKLGLDYGVHDAQSSSLIIPAGQLSGSIEIPIIQDAIDEGDELFSVHFLGLTEGAKLIDDKINITIENSFVQSRPIQITKILYLKETDQLEITWKSNPSENYKIFSSVNLSAWKEEIMEPTPSGGDKTTKIITLNGDEQRFYKVQKAQ